MIQRNLAKPTICVAGAGAVGIALAARLMLGGYDVGLIARGEAVQFARNYGVCLVDKQGTHHLFPEVGQAADFLQADILFLCSKSHDLPGLALAVQHLIAARTIVVPIINGIPWWYFDGLDGNWAGRHVSAVDPSNMLKHLIPSRQIIGTTTIMTVEKTDRTTARTFNPLQMTLGELDDQRTARLADVVSVLEQSGISTCVPNRLRDAIWTKVVRNLISNPLTAITGATLRENFGNTHLAAVSRKMLDEVLPVVTAYGARLEVDPETILRAARRMGSVKTSMLQDIERGNRLELASICDAVLELAYAHNISMPVTQAICSIAHFKDPSQNAMQAA